MLMEEIGEFVLDRCSEAQYAEARIEIQETEGFLLKNGIPEISGFDSSRGVAIRVILDGAVGFASTNLFNKKNIEKACIRALKIARQSRQLIRDPVKFAEDKSSVDEYSVKQKKKTEDISAEDKLTLLKSFNGQVKETQKEVTSSYFSLNSSNVKKYFYNSEGSKIISEIPRLSSFWFFTAQNQEKSLQRYKLYYGTGGFELIDKWDIGNEIQNEINSLHNTLIKGRKAQEGVYDLICGEEISGIASHESVGHPFEADRILGRESAQAGESFVTEKMIGEQYCNENINVHENPLISGSAGYYLYDDEGVKARNRILIKNGLVNEFLHNRESAYKMGTSSNASARASSYRNEPIIRMANSYIDGGDSSEEEIISETKRGIYMKSFMEWNIDDKRYNQKYVGSEAYYVEDGEIKCPVINPVLEISTSSFWKSISLLGKKVKMFSGPCGKGEPMQTAPVLMGGPVMKLKNVRIK